MLLAPAESAHCHPDETGGDAIPRHALLGVSLGVSLRSIIAVYRFQRREGELGWSRSAARGDANNKSVRDGRICFVEEKIILNEAEMRVTLCVGGDC